MRKILICITLASAVMSAQTTQAMMVRGDFAKPIHSSSVQPVWSQLMGFPAYRACLQNQVRQAMNNLHGNPRIDQVIEWSTNICLGMMMY